MLPVKSRYSRYSRWCVALVCVSIFLVLAGHGVSQTTSRDAGLPVSEQVLAELDRANAARAKLSSEQSKWRAEKQKIELLLSTIRQQTRNCQAQADRDNKLRQLREKQIATFETNRKRLADIETMLDSLCERLEVSLAKLRAENLPGLVPPDRAQSITDPAGRLASATGRIEEALARGKNSSVELVTGSLAGEEITIKLLRAGAAAAWWVSLDGLQAGTARMERGKLVLTRAAEAVDNQSIIAAFNVIEGRLAPSWLLLPADQLKISSDKEAKQ